MQPYPHTYVASVAAESTGGVTVGLPRLPDLETAGPGGMWLPETLLCASIADCFILTFRAVAVATKLEWRRLECRVEGVLGRLGQESRFTHFTILAKLTVPAATHSAKARALLEQAEYGCLIANSLRGTRALAAQVIVEDPANACRSGEPAEVLP